MKKKITIHDIAKHANTSTATVSRVLNNTGYPVKKDLRKRVLDAVEEFKYAPNLVGKQLKTNSNVEIGVVIPNISNPYYSLLISGIEYVARQNNYYIILCNSNGDSELEKDYLKYLYQKQIKGVIISSVNEDVSYLEFMKQNGVQLVAFEQEIQLNCNKINFDYYRGGYLATKHLIEKGHTNIGFISSPLTRHSRKKVFEGFKACLSEHNVNYNPDFISIGSYDDINSGHIFEYQNGKDLMLDLIKNDNIPQAIFCINDMTAFGVIQQLNNHNIRVPDDIAVVGFDNIDICEIISPSLTTIDQSTFEMGKLAMDALLYSLNENSKNSFNNILQPTLIERKST